MQTHRRAFKRSSIVLSVSEMVPSFLGSPDSRSTIQRLSYLRRHFLYFALIASLNHALSYIVTSYASSLLGPSLSSTILGLSWGLNSISGLTIATPVVKLFGWKYSMIIALLGYTIQISSLYLSLLHPPWTKFVTIFGAIIAGFTSAIWWTAQGVVFDKTCHLSTQLLICQQQQQVELADVDINTISNDISSELAAYWTVIYQLSDIIIFISLSFFPIVYNISFIQMLFIFTCIGLITTLLGFSFDPLVPNNNPELDSNQQREEESYTINDFLSDLLLVPKLFLVDSRISLLAPFVFGFGVTTAMFTYYINDNSITDIIGKEYIGIVESYSYFIATISAIPYSMISRYYPNSGQHFVMQFGSLCFMLTGVMILCYSNQELSNWKYILLIRGLYGLGRGVFEGACRVTYSILFKRDNLITAAYSAQTLLAGVSGGVCYFCYSIISRQAIGTITVVNGIIALIGYQLLISTPNYKHIIPWGSLCAGQGKNNNEYVAVEFSSSPSYGINDESVNSIVEK